MAGGAEAEKEVTCPGSTLKWFSGLGRESGWGPGCSSILCAWSQQAAQRFSCSPRPFRCCQMSSGLGRAEGAPGRTRLASGGPAFPRPPGGPFSTARGGPCGRGSEGGTTTGGAHGAGKPLGPRRRAERGAEGHGAAAAGLRSGGSGVYGHYLKAPCTEPCGNSTCLMCPQDTFLAWENHHNSECARCQACDEQASQVALENCSAVADTRCGCKPGWFVECQVSQCVSSSPFYCQPCLDCRALHRHTRLLCSRRDTDCGTCLPGFYEHGDGCVSCPTSTLGSCPERCAAVCGWRQMFWVQVLLAGLVVPLLLGATLTYTYRHCWPHKPMVTDEAGMEALTPPPATHLSPSDNAHTLLVPPDSSEKIRTVQLVGNSCTPGYPQTQEALYPQVTWSWDQLPNRALGPAPAPTLLPESPVGSPAMMLQPGPQLYDVMDAVPARRWKEFVRTLGLREAEIEAVEVEIGRFRDQQYEMLKRWRQQQPAGLGAVYAALERMGLDGCAEDLRSRLQRGP
ncbi:tumor necrosis factor receptor superfamily member 25 isoform X4 [Rhinopithecus roxellana]|uniref:tumor necrosis factor receptor superfamily member 25 isoform X4 n=1 Tax=Rhinopithecus roxellana TaxID=61622 RepID=UPI0012374F79|nr:tumor necrosis factor receptor superfamily member 25 isoform X4 [Rhinopithecus roxellana]